MEHNSEIKGNGILRIQVILTERGKRKEISKEQKAVKTALREL